MVIPIRQVAVDEIDELGNVKFTKLGVGADPGTEVAKIKLSEKLGVDFIGIYDSDDALVGKLDSLGRITLINPLTGSILLKPDASNRLELRNAADDAQSSLFCDAINLNGTAYMSGGILNYGASTQQPSGYLVARRNSMSILAASAMSGASVAMGFTIPDGSIITGFAYIVETLITSGDGGVSMDIDLSGGSAVNIVTASAFAKNTKDNFPLAIATTPGGGATDIVLSPDAGTFSAGKVWVAVFYTSTEGFADFV